MKTTGQLFGQSWARLVQRCAVGSLLIASVSGVPFVAAEPPDREGLSQRISDAILADYRSGERRAPAPSTADAGPEEVEPGLVTLPHFRVRDEPDTVKLKQEDVLANPRTAPLVLGSGITEYKGKKFTMSTQKLFFVPIGWKIAW